MFRRETFGVSSYLFLNRKHVDTIVTVAPFKPDSKSSTLSLSSSQVLADKSANISDKMNFNQNFDVRGCSVIGT